MQNPTLFLPGVRQEVFQKLTHFEALRDLIFRLIRHFFLSQFWHPCGGDAAKFLLQCSGPCYIWIYKINKTKYI